MAAGIVQVKILLSSSVDNAEHGDNSSPLIVIVAPLPTNAIEQSDIVVVDDVSRFSTSIDADVLLFRSLILVDIS